MRERRMALRWSIVTAGLIALFWAIWWLINGSVPVITSIRMTENWTLVLPFGISRWWDILIGPIWSTAIVFLMTNKRVKEDQYLILGLISGIGLILGLILGLAYGLGFGLAYGLGFGLAGGLVFGLAGGLALGLVYGLAYGLGFGLAYGLVFGLGFGLAYGLVFGLVALLTGRRL
jgi:hypothetical protein